ncbi:PAC2 family protein [Microbacteriaceae bacterium MWH-Ta3]|nr:PAC2 family protein [Microbacteriaceae bacterium MWH-Ta3]
MSMFSVQSGRPLVVAFEGWNDAGEAASTAVRAIIDRYNLVQGFGVETELFYDYQLVRPTIEFADDSRRIAWPTTSLFVPADLTTRVHALLGTEPSRSWPTFAATFLDEALAADITGIIVVGSMLADVPHSRPIEVTRTSDNADVRKLLGCERSQYEGPIGIPTVFAQFAEQVGIPTVAVWASVPHYVHNSPSPKVALALVEALKDITHADLDTVELAAAAIEWEKSVNEMAGSDDDMSEYIAQLEEQRDTANSEEASGDAIAEEFERFLRDTEEGDSR